ncbi:MAG TPA: translocation/assembly module TamB domain-containing protein [Chitinophagales bacterium]|nr:translocation/assembly module TamB domain-containing protein [Chitinophagales bacterium]
MKKSRVKQFIKASLIVFIIVLVVFNILFYLLGRPDVQTYLAKKAAAVLTSATNAPASVGNVEFRLRKIVLNDVFLGDLRNDTLLYVHHLKVQPSLRGLLKRKIDVRSLELEDGKLHIRREEGSEKFNYEFLTGEKTSREKSDESKGFHFRLPKAELKNLDFHFLDEREKNEYRIAFKELTAEDVNINEQEKYMKLGTLGIDGANILVKKIFTSECDTTPPGAKLPPQMLNNAGWDVAAGHITLSNSSFAYVNENRLYSRGGMNYNDLHIRNIHIELENTLIVCDTIRSKIIHLSAAEKSGFVLQSMSAEATVSTTELECRNLSLATDNSAIRDYLKFSYDSFRDFLDFVNKVKMQGDFKNSRVAMKDINYFAGSALDKIEHNTVWLTGTVKGTVSNLKGKDLNLSLSRNTRFRGDFGLKGLPLFKETFITLRVSGLQTTLSEFRTIYPHIHYPSNLENLGRVNFTGSFTGFTNDFVANGSLATEIGSVSSDINFKIDPRTNIARYSGNFAAQNFHVGKYINEENFLGEITLNARLKGKGLKLENVEASVNGIINKFSVSGHDYMDMKVDGDLKKRFFKGVLAVKDDNLDMDFEGTVDLTDTVPVFQFVSDLRKANLRELNLSKDDISLSSFLRIDFTGLTPDKFNGYAGVFNTQVEKNNIRYHLDTFELKAYPTDGGSKEVALKTDIAEATLTGNFTYEDLPDALLDLLRHYSDSSKTYLSGKGDQVFVLNLRLNNTRNLTTFIDTAFKNIGEGYVNFAFNNNGYRMYLNSWFNEVSYGDFKVNELLIKSETDNEGLAFKTSMDSLFYKDSLVSVMMNFNSRIQPDSILFSLTAQPDDSPTRLALNGNLDTDFKSVEVQLLPSAVYLEGNKWTVSQGNKLFFDGEKLLVENLSFRHDESSVEFKSFIDAAGGNHLSAFFKKFNLHEVTKSFLRHSKLELGGVINGTATIMNIIRAPAITASLTVDTFRVNKHFIGNILVNSNYQPGDERAEITASLSGAENNLRITGFYDLKKKGNYLDFSVDIQNLHLQHMEPFIQKDVSRIQGDVAGKLFVKGSLKDFVMEGAVTAKNTSARVNYLNTIYSFDNEEITFSKNLIKLGDIHLKDEEGNDALAGGEISYESPLKNFKLDIDIRTDDFLFLNTSYSRSQPFYGKLIADGVVFIKGPFNNVEFYISAKTKRGTDVYIDVAGTKDVSQYSFYRFIDPTGTKKMEERFVSKIKGVTLNCDIEATPDADVNLILNYEQGDVINAKGNGNLKVVLSSLGELSISGEYRITDGNYVFSMQNVISKRFSMERGSSIRWNGDPTNATLDITGLYKLRASPYDLLADIVTTDAEIQKAKNRVQVLLYLYITGSLAQPEIKFDIKVPDADPAIRTSLESKFQLLAYNPNELNRQVVGLLVLNRFLPQKNTNSETNVASAVNTSVSEFLSNQLSVYLSDWISEFITEIQLDINYRSYQLENGTVTGPGGQIDFENRQELQLALTKTFFNDRISIDVGGDFDFGQTSASTAQKDKVTNIAGDFEIEYSITPDGRIKIKAFRKGEYDIFQDRNKNKTGVGISYQKEFNSVKDFFQKIRKRKEEKKKELKQQEGKSDE